MKGKGANRDMAIRATINHIELCAGAGMLGVGLHAAIPGLRTVCYVEREAYAAATLVARMEDAALDRAPVWDDLRTFDGRPWHGVVDLVSAGFPCQPHSVAGLQLGAADDRWLFDDILRIIVECGAPVAFFENVPGLLSSNRGSDFRRVLESLAEIGFDAQWDIFGAGAVGASHRRERVFILAYAENLRGREFVGRQPNGTDAQLGDAQGNGRIERGAEPAGQFWISAAGWNGGELADAGGERFQGGQLAGPSEERDWSQTHGSIGEPGGLVLFAPSPNDPRWPAIIEQRPDVEPAVCRVADGLANRVDRLRLVGNGVVPLAAAVAFRVLADRARKSRDQG